MLNPFKQQSRFLWAIAATCSALMLSTIPGMGRASAEGLSNPMTAPSSAQNSGISLYGETPHANQPGQGYMIFEQRGQTLIGVFYYPQSEFSCFTGQRKGQQLEILTLPSHQDTMTSLSLSLLQLKPISSIGPSERDALATCRQDVIAFLQQQQTAQELKLQWTN